MRECPTNTMATWTKWTPAEEAALLTEIKTVKSIHEIAKLHNRTSGAIQARLQKIFMESILEGKPLQPAVVSFLKQKLHREAQSPLTMEFKETFTREKLQGLAEERRLQQLAAFINNRIAPSVTQTAMVGKTSFLYERPDSTNPIQHAHEYIPADEELMDGLRIKFPGCTVTQSEEWVDVPAKRLSDPPTRVLKKGIKIDWS